MRILADTNVVARIAQPGHHQHAAALQAVERILARDDDVCIVPQVVYEFWVVATRPATANGLAMDSPRALGELAKIRGIFTLLRDERAIFQEWERLISLCDVRGKQAHDARLAAAMARHGLAHILTFNSADFARFPNLNVITPDEVR